MIRVLIADDERPARSYLRAILDKIDEVVVAGEVENGAEVIEYLKENEIDLVLMDLQMPEVSGIEAVRMMDVDTMPLVAFVTAYDEYAVNAFDLNAVDYLLKPVDPVRLRRTIDRAISRINSDGDRSDVVGHVVAASDQIHSQATNTPLRRIPVKKKSDIVFVNVSDVASVVAEGELLHLFTNKGDRSLITYRLKDLESRLDSDEFIRISRGVIVNASAIDRVSPMPGGTYLVTLHNKQEFTSSRSRSKVLRDTLFRL